MSKWDLSGYFKTNEEWSAKFNELNESIPELNKFKGKLGKKATLIAYLQKSKELELVLMPLYGYAHQSADLDQSNQEYAGRMQQLGLLFAKWSNATSFYESEIIALGEKKINSFLKKDNFLKDYAFSFRSLFHNQRHVLSEKEEMIFANFSPISGSIDDVYNSVYAIDRKNEVVSLSDGQERTITLSNYRSIIPELKNANDRKIVFEAAFKRFQENKNTFANIYNSVLLSLQASYKSRSFNSALEAKLYSHNIPLEVFNNLKNVVYENTNLVKRYLELRKKALKISDYHTWDRFIELAYSSKKYDYQEAKEIFFEAIKLMPEEYIEAQKSALEDGYVDVQSADTKRTGAYSTHFYGYHPYILLNHDKSLDSVFTLAHEAGHSAHSIFSAKNQPYPTHGYEIFVAEIASTFNEHLLLDYLLEKSTSKKEKIALLEKAINNILSTFYRQTLFAHYEYEANELLAKGEPITADALSKIMIELYQHYYDLDITKEGPKQYVWAYIPHLFHTPFYVYQYATSFAASLKFYENIKSQVPQAYENYLSLLKSGGSDFPVTLVMKAGVDLTAKEAYLAVVHRFEELLNKLAQILEK
ncbi:MAG: oligoendopeptidase F [Acholeplasmatales bacterium]|jgi:oligoendopeptidase F|nr:oligoendopeptidase F [Acholeplasmatales bacterium]